MKPIYLALLIFALSSTSYAAEEAAEAKAKPAEEKNEISDILNAIGYPELQVVPRASERLAIEAKAEESSFAFTHWPIQISGLATLAIGFTAKSNQRLDLSEKEKRDANSAATITTTIGATWLVGGIIMGAQRPYRAGIQALGKNQGKDERSVLLRERLAEEALERPARYMRILQTVSVVTNLGACALVGAYSTDNGKITAGVGALLALLPLMFEDHNIAVHNKHIEYKKKIYAPIASTSIHVDQKTNALTPVTTLAWSF